MFLLFQLLSLIHYVSADLVKYPEPDMYGNTVDENNIIAASLWAMGMCSCIGFVCKHKNKLPINISPIEGFDHDVKYQIETNGKTIKELKDNIDKFKNIIDQLYIEEKEKECMKVKEKKGIEDWIDHSIRYIFGTGEIRYKENGKYYHGVGINDKYKWNEDNRFDKCIYEYMEGKDLRGREEWNSHNVKEFCNDCSFDKEKTGRKRNYKVYKCNGHCI